MVHKGSIQMPCKTSSLSTEELLIGFVSSITCKSNDGDDTVRIITVSDTGEGVVLGILEVEW